MRVTRAPGLPVPRGPSAARDLAVTGRGSLSSLSARARAGHETDVLERAHGPASWWLAHEAHSESAQVMQPSTPHQRHVVGSARARLRPLGATTRACRLARVVAVSPSDRGADRAVAALRGAGDCRPARVATHARLEPLETGEPSPRPALGGLLSAVGHEPGGVRAAVERATDLVTAVPRRAAVARGALIRRLWSIRLALAPCAGSVLRPGGGRGRRRPRQARGAASVCLVLAAGVQRVSVADLLLTAVAAHEPGRRATGAAERSRRYDRQPAVALSQAVRDVAPRHWHASRLARAKGHIGRAIDAAIRAVLAPRRHNRLATRAAVHGPPTQDASSSALGTAAPRPRRSRAACRKSA